MIFGACVFLGTALLQVTNAVSMNSYAQNLFEETLAWQDEFWDEAAGYLVTADLTLPGRWDTRQTAWYSTGLLARNGTGDVARAKRIINQVIDMQYTTPGVAWYGTYQQSPEEPLPGTSLYGTEVYTNFDPNWRDFICTSWIIAIEEFSDLLGDDLVEKMVSSMNISALGALTRVGLNGDNLLLTYTNPELMRTMDVAWLGYRLNDKNFTDFAEARAQAHYDIFTYNDFNTFPEYNTATYLGIDLYALSLWIKYMPSTSNLAKYAPFMIQKSMEDLGTFYNAYLKNLAGPWDRTYGMDMTQYTSIIAMWIWAAVGKEYAPLPETPLRAWHVADYGFGHLVSLTSDIVLANTPDSALASFKEFQGERSFTRHMRSSQSNDTFRTDTAWLNATHMIGGQQVNETFGFRSSYAYNPAVILWEAQDDAPTLSWLTFWATTGSINATASKDTLEVIFPYPQPSSTFKWLVGGLPINQGRGYVDSLETLPGLPLTLTTEGVNLTSVYYDMDIVVHLFHSYAFIYTALDGYTGDIKFKFELAPGSKNVSTNSSAYVAPAATVASTNIASGSVKITTGLAVAVAALGTALTL
ncbi:hypothetical protein HDU83_007398 [Entophlyctis luteolus]|nr:hypothetical protein HDU83_007398 [Entophlyctis luteolus]